METRYAANTDELISEHIEGETVLLNVQNGAYYTLNDTGTAIWRALADGYAPAHILRAIAERFALDLAAVRSQCSAFIASLVQERILLPGQALAMEGLGPDWGSGFSSYNLPSFQKFSHIRLGASLIPGDPDDDPGLGN